MPLTGSEAAKNQKAAAKLQELLDDCVWVNMHQILDAGSGVAKLKAKEGEATVSGESAVSTSSICVLEVRLAEGYGARWGWQKQAASSQVDLQRRFEQWERQRRKQCDADDTEQSEDDEEERTAATATGGGSEGLGVSFRGFVEPMQAGGHSNKWRHQLH
mmetsp:Transcript_7160/g.12011  ORF Transcript_7160/g.12011 Transcript_7160/m.12011 type:complete len:160 (+) Transcript_7160:726-1205(+)